jgi:hypothetical protein
MQRSESDSFKLDPDPTIQKRPDPAIKKQIVIKSRETVRSMCLQFRLLGGVLPAYRK